ncbi:pyroglutamyl-peptidase I family protein [Jiella marina]|uniref:pyroglutamyl-peptidase I family protein n=1 Tax=Jiella sp. LLJ827 TaxID=2917712 RepID=UPI00210178A0|nr:hypothetical protein [Jiella sp. LLJ827]MCQ0989124.1 hypothetical protein [Jiella sp. LLJ827]
MSILVAGFSSFPGVATNPSEDMIRRLEARTAESTAVATLVLPVEWESSWPRLKEAIAATGATSVLLFGLHMRCERFRVELMARNHRELGRADAVNAFPAGPSISDGPKTIPCRLDWGAVAKALRDAGTDFEWSTHAGGYLCNDTLYRLAERAASLGVERFGFFHMPLSDERVGEYVDRHTLPEVFMSMPAGRMDAAALALIAMLAPGNEERVDP